jgi:hypothetical protein
MKQYVYNIPCDCGRCYIGKISGSLEVQNKDHKNTMNQGLLRKYKLAQHAYEGHHKIFWKEGKVLQIEPTPYTRNTRNLPTYVADLISQPNLDISPICSPVIAAEVRKLQLNPV